MLIEELDRLGTEIRNISQTPRRRGPDDQGRHVDRRSGLSAANIGTALDDSLRRLRTGHVDVCFAHVDDESVPFKETLGAFSRLVEAGKVCAIGASNHSAGRLQAALDTARATGLPRCEIVQPAYNLYDRKDFEQSLLPVIQSEALGAASYFSLASGFLTGKYRSTADLEGSSRKDFLEGYFNDRGQRILTALRVVSGEVGAPQVQVALAWLMSRPG
ncbi:aldo/keto reductase [Paracoccus chinensis]|uniref:aldo/keto reductase n=1 Tax=Paracoccus chinensis TaxID=525640 RepID=UPI002481164A|nr:aldo/keto reductase [Paracoccus chinensis]